MHVVAPSHQTTERFRSERAPYGAVKRAAAQDTTNRRKSVAISRREEVTLYSGEYRGGISAGRRIERFGQRFVGADVTTIPARYRSGPNSPKGVLAAVRVRPGTGEGWVRLRSRTLPWRTTVLTIPLNTVQGPVPPPESIEVRGNLRVRCHDGEVGRLTGIAINLGEGLISDLIVRVRESVMANVSGPTSPMAALLDVRGQEVLLPPSWVVSITQDTNFFGGDEPVLLLNASAEQIGSGMLIRTDGQLVADIWNRWADNPSIAPYAERVSAEAHDGDVTLRGHLPSPRHKATAEQDVWHVLGVLAVHNRITVG